MKIKRSAKISKAINCVIICIILIMCAACGPVKIGNYRGGASGKTGANDKAEDITGGIDESGIETEKDAADETAGEYFFLVEGDDETTLKIETGTISQSVKKYSKSDKENSKKNTDESSSSSAVSKGETEASRSAAPPASEASATTHPSSATTAVKQSEQTVPTTKERTSATTTTWVYTTAAPFNAGDRFDKKFYYKMLTDSQKRIYETAYAAVSDGSAEFGYTAESGFVKNDLSKAVHAFRNDFPEFCSLNGGYHSLQKGKDITVTLSTRSFCSDPSGGSYRSEIIAKAKQISSQAGRYSAAFDQIKYVHDYLCRTVEYDYDSLTKSSESKTPYEQMSNTAYGALINGKAVCGGISYAFELIMQQLGYECGYISGNAKGGSHAWNMIKAGGNYYCIDVTFDDHIEKGKDYIEYNYFCITSTEMSRDHTPANEFAYPYADSNDMNYYYRNGYVIYSVYSSADYGILEAQAQNDYIYVKFTTDSAYKIAKNGDSNLFKDVRALTGRKTVTYYHDDEFRVLAFKV